MDRNRNTLNLVGAALSLWVALLLFSPESHAATCPTGQSTPCDTTKGTWANGGLIPRSFDGGNTVKAYYDTAQGITWLWDANYAQTTGFAGLTITGATVATGQGTFNAFNQNTTGYFKRTDKTIPLTTGADVGTTGWRVPQMLGAVTTGSATCPSSTQYTTPTNANFSGICGYNVTNTPINGISVGNPSANSSEFAYLWNVLLGNSSTGAATTVQNTGPFVNVQTANPYWINAADGTGSNYVFQVNTGIQASISKNTTTNFGWAVHNGQLGVPYVPRPSDFDGDRMSDVLWRNASTGAISIWAMNGLTAHGAGGPGLGVVTPDWVIAGVGDFDGDGKVDFLWRNTDPGSGAPGVVAIWFMNGGIVNSSPSMGAVPLDWTIAGVGDFDGDGKADILWRNTTTNAAAIWLMNGSSIKSAAGLGSVDTTVWTVAGVADFDGDGRSDILWRDSSGNVAMWLMNGTALKASAAIGNVDPTAWTIAGVGDFDGDGSRDILWRGSTGDVAIWEMTGATIKLGAGLGNVDPAWTIAGVGDFDTDGKSDILWRNTSGDVAIWEMNGVTVKAGAGQGVIDTSWQIVKSGG